MKRWSIAVLVVVIGGFVAVTGSGGPPTQSFCAGVGLLTDTYGATPRAALEAYVRSRGGDPKHWRLVGTSSFEAEEPRARPRGLGSIGASEESPGVWRVSGGCVGNYGPAPIPTGPGIHPDFVEGSNTCERSEIEATVSEGRSQAPFATWVFALKNVSTHTCVFDGYAGVTMNPDAYQLSFAFVRRGGVLIADAEPREVKVPRGKTAYFVIEKDACALTDTIAANHAKIYFRPWKGQSASIPVPGRFALCGGASSYDDDLVFVTPVVASLDKGYRPTPAKQRCRPKDLAAYDAGLTREADGYTAWGVRLENVGATPCELRGTPGFFISAGLPPLVGITAKPATADGRFLRAGPRPPLTIAPRSSAFIAFEKLGCAQTERAVTQLGLRPPAARASMTVPIPTGLAKCDFKEPAANVIWFSPFTAGPAEVLN